MDKSVTTCFYGRFSVKVVNVPFQASQVPNVQMTILFFLTNYTVTLKWVKEIQTLSFAL